MALMPLKRILEKIPPEKFVRIHRSYIIAIDKIKISGTKSYASALLNCLPGIVTLKI